jgi:hypothetical protein
MTPDDGMTLARSELLVRLRAEIELPDEQRETRASSESLARVIQLVEALDLDARPTRPVGIGREVTDCWSLSADLSADTVAFEQAAIGRAG